MSLFPLMIACLLVLNDWTNWDSKPAKGYQVIKHFEYVAYTSILALIASLVDANVLLNNVQYAGIITFGLLGMRIAHLFDVMQHKGWVVCFKSPTHGYVSRSFMLYADVDLLIYELNEMGINYKVYVVDPNVKACNKNDYYLTKYIQKN